MSKSKFADGLYETLGMDESDRRFYEALQRQGKILPSDHWAWRAFHEVMECMRAESERVFRRLDRIEADLKEMKECPL